MINLKKLKNLILSKFFLVTRKKDVIINASNLYGKGASLLVLNLIKELEKKHNNTVLILPESGLLSKYKSSSSRTVNYKRYFFNKISRVYECLFFYSISKSNIIYTLGDIPVSFKGTQIVLMHSPNLFWTPINEIKLRDLKYLFLRTIFKLNLKQANKFVVQTQYIKNQLLISYNIGTNDILVSPQPPPFVTKNYKQNISPYNGSLKLFYPAVYYSHKNHIILKGLKKEDCEVVDNISLTLDQEDLPFTLGSDLINYIGVQDEKGVNKNYMSCDALLFLSKKETYGFPLIEAIYLNKPIICSKLGYSEAIFGSHPDIIYFDPNDVTTLRDSFHTLHDKLNRGWRPNWDNLKQNFPNGWHEVADFFYNLSCKSALREKKYLISGIGPGPSGVGRLMSNLVIKLNNKDYNYVYRRNALSLRKLKTEKKYLTLLLEILKRKLNVIFFNFKIFFIKNTKIIVIHPQTIGYDLFFRLLKYNRIFLYVMDNSFFCVRSYNVHPILENECLQCIDKLSPHEECDPSPVSMSQTKNIKHLENLKKYSKNIIFLSQNKNQSLLLKLHFGNSVKVRIIGMDTNEIKSENEEHLYHITKYDIVFHGKPLIAKGILYFIKLAAILPELSFFIPDTKENVKLVFNADLPSNIFFKNITWETGLLEIVEKAKLVINPSLWSAPIEGALVKSAAHNSNVATVESKYGYEKESSMIRNHLRLSSDLNEAKSQVRSFLRLHFN